MRNVSGSQRPQATEYKEKFVPPCCHKALITTSNKLHTYHQLKGTPLTEMTTLRSVWIKKPQKKRGPQAPAAHKEQSSADSPASNRLRFVEKQKSSAVEDYISTYTRDFQGRKATEMCQPFKAHGNFNVNQGLVVASNSQCQENSVPDAEGSPQVPKVIPFESVTRYRSDYVVHPLQPRFRRYKPSRKSKPTPSNVSMLAWDRDQDLFEEAGELLQRFKTWSLKAKFPAEDKEPGPPADHRELTGPTNPTACAPNCAATKPQSTAENGAVSGFQPVSTRTEESVMYWSGCDSPAACCLAETKVSQRPGC